MNKETSTIASAGFPPVSRSDARILILGSLPGQRSLQAQEYYAHQQNAFWRIMRKLIGASGSYEERLRTLVEHRIALWDVLASSVRVGSMDANIRKDTAKVNDFKGFFLENGAIERIAFNGLTAAGLYQKLVQNGIDGPHPELLILPSTSPAYATMPFAKKLAKWRNIFGQTIGR